MNDLTQAATYFQPIVFQLLEACAKVGVPCRIVDIARTPSQQLVKIQTGVSWTNNSRHLPQPPEGKSEAVDIVPLAVLSEHKPDWDPKNPAWQIIGSVGKQIMIPFTPPGGATQMIQALEWGGDWKEHPDPSHFQYAGPKSFGPRPGVVNV
jgi:hypothetical protein